MAFALTRAATTAEIAEINRLLTGIGKGALSTQPATLQNELKQALIYNVTLRGAGKRIHMNDDLFAQIISNYEVVSASNIT